ncbi:MAG: fructosamine kinase family protein [Burkholderiales bacterium]|nr:fructosamine kinase family protein [Nitrosomonas sp.]MCP5273927.1 fructosamine kinase family protein [Burkholderiales bacterium]
MNAWPEISKQISASTHQPFELTKITTVSGGCINQTFCVADDQRRFFVKTNRADGLPMFSAEAAGLDEIGRSNTLRVPQPVCWGQNEHNAWLVLEHIDLNHRSSNAESLGRGLAAMHAVKAAQFGWTRDNTIGSTPQINTLSSDWLSFWRTNRLKYQLDLAKTKGHHGKLQNLGEQLLENLDQFFTSYVPTPSLLHGDLWRGNFSYDHTGQPVLFDPAVYHGDRETDLAMTELFGGFPERFYSAYRHEYPLDSGYNTRKIFYNLYHILNHLNLFGGGYRHQAEQMMIYLLAEIR